jgi:hypothetical protein
LREQLHYLLDIGKHWRKAIQVVDVNGDWCIPVDLPGEDVTRSLHLHNDLNPTESGRASSDDLASSDDSESGGELESMVDEDNIFDNLIENISDDHDPAMSEGGTEVIDPMHLDSSTPFRVRVVNPSEFSSILFG